MNNVQAGCAEINFKILKMSYLYRLSVKMLICLTFGFNLITYYTHHFVSRGGIEI